MGRGVVKIEKIEEEKRRQSTLRKRKKSLFKKAWEFCTLCGVDTLIILYDPITNPNEPETWPENLDEVKRIINRYQEISSVNRRRSFHLPDFFSEKTRRIDHELQQLQKETANSDKYPLWDERFNSLSQNQLVIILSKLDTKLDVVRNRINEKRACELVNFDIQADSLEPKGMEYQYLPAMTQTILNNMNYLAEEVRPIEVQFPCNPMVPFNNYNPNLLQNTVMMQYSPAALNRQMCLDLPWMQGNLTHDNVNPLMSYYAQTMQQSMMSPPLQPMMIPPLHHSIMQMDPSSQTINSFQDNYSGSFQNHESQNRH